MLVKEAQSRLHWFLEEGQVDELLDVLEMVIALADGIRVSKEELEQSRRRKVEEEGGFDVGIMIEAIAPQIVSRRPPKA